MSRQTMSEHEHVATKGRLCPVCQSDQTEGHSVDTGDGQAMQEMTCLTCGSGWIDVYTLTGYLLQHSQASQDNDDDDAIRRATLADAESASSEELEAASEILDKQADDQA